MARYSSDNKFNKLTRQRNIIENSDEEFDSSAEENTDNKTATPSANMEFDAINAGPLPNRDSEIDLNGMFVDWKGDALKIRDRISQEQPERSEDVPYNGLQMKLLPAPENVNESSKIVLPEKNADTYELEKYRKNAMIIFNNKIVLGGKVRKYTMKDEAALKSTFGKFGFIVESHLDLTKAALMQELKEFCSKDFSDYGCICAVIMTHGSKHGYLRAHDIRYSEHEIIENFNAEKNITMLGKPVIIIIQACRGDEPATAVDPYNPKTEEQLQLDYDDYTLPTEADMLIFHSSYIGRASASTSQGSWFIQALCDQINLLATVADFESICRAVKREVATEKQHNMTLGQKEIVVKQMPVMTSTLMRLLYLKRFEGTDQEDGTKGSEDLKKYEKGICSENIAELCGCAEYFDYLKTCLRLFIVENPEDDVAQSILKIAEKNQTVNGVKLVDLIRKYLSRNTARFTRSDVMYLGGPCCCRVKEERTENPNYCKVG